MTSPSETLRAAALEVMDAAKQFHAHVRTDSSFDFVQGARGGCRVLGLNPENPPSPNCSANDRLLRAIPALESALATFSESEGVERALNLTVTPVGPVDFALHIEAAELRRRG